MLEHGGDIKGFQDEYGTRPLDYSANIAPLGIPDPVRQAVIDALDDSTDYPDPLCRDLVAALAAHEQVDASFILCGNGSSDLLFRLVAATKPRRALLCAPTFAEYEQALSTEGSSLDFYQLSPLHDFTVGEDFIDWITPETDLVVLCQPNNPSGMIVPRKLLGRILERCKECSALLLVDECFVGFLDDPDDVTVTPWLAAEPALVVLKAFTKLYGIPGMRLGYALTSNAELLENMRAAGQPWSVSNLAQAAGVAALTCADYVDEVRAITRQERAFLQQELQKREITSWGSANFLLFRVAETPHAPLFVQQMRTLGVLVRDCANYRELKQGWYRIAVRSHDENIRLLAAIDTVLQQREKEAR